jgi:hypothetical protein
MEFVILTLGIALPLLALAISPDHGSAEMKRWGDCIDPLACSWITATLAGNGSDCSGSVSLNANSSRAIIVNSDHQRPVRHSYRNLSRHGALMIRLRCVCSSHQDLTAEQTARPVISTWNLTPLTNTCILWYLEQVNPPLVRRKQCRHVQGMYMRSPFRRCSLIPKVFAQTSPYHHSCAGEESL